MQPPPSTNERLLSNDSASAQLEGLLQGEERQRMQAFAKMSHELRNPLAAIFLATERIRRAKDIDDQIRYVNIIDRQLSIITQIVDDLPNIVKAAVDTRPLNYKKFEVQVAINAALFACHGEASKNGQTLHVLMPEATIVVEANEGHFDQMLTNLVMNALKYSPRGTVVVSVRAECEQLILRVVDNGIGIDQASLSSIFDLFARESEAVHLASGLGIGLAIVRELATAHGGSISANSSGAGQGSEFTLMLPLSHR
jgi:signal transduction histidine kinase